MVPASYPETAFMELLALRRPEWPMIYQNIPSDCKTLIVPTVTADDFVECGWVPILRNFACFPAAFYWLSSYWRDDRTTYWLELHSVRKQTCVSSRRLCSHAQIVSLLLQHGLTTK